MQTMAMLTLTALVSYGFCGCTQKTSSERPSPKPAVPTHVSPAAQELEEHASIKAYPGAVTSTTDEKTGKTVKVAKDGRMLLCVSKKGMALWQVDLIEPRANVIGSPVIRHVFIKDRTIYATVGKHAFYGVDLDSGKIIEAGSD